MTIFFNYGANSRTHRAILVAALILALSSLLLDIWALSSLDQNLSSIEIKLFEHDYPKDDDKTRLDRIEKFVFGTTNSGSGQERLDSLLKVIPLPVNTVQNNGDTTSNTTTETNQTAFKDHPTPKVASIKSTNKAFDYSHYPRVTALEQQLLGKTYVEQNLSERLNRLENHCFGKPVNNSDLNQRVENLEAYVERHDIYGQQSTVNNFTKHNQKPYTTQQGTSSEYTPANQQNIEVMVSAMEVKLFGHDYPHRSLQKRITKLEKQVYGYDKNNLSVLTRISNLWSVLNKNNPEQSISTSMPDQYSSSSNGSAYNSNSTNTNYQKPHHSLLHKAGQVVGTVGGATIKALSSPYGGYGMGNYGMGYGMNNYGMGGYPMGGYGMGNYGMGGSPMGGYGNYGYSTW